MDKRELARRVSEARRLLDEPLLNEALDVMESRAIEELVKLPDDADRARFDIACRVRIIRGMRGYLQATILAGEQSLKPKLRLA